MNKSQQPFDNQNQINYAELGIEPPTVQVHEERIPLNVGKNWKQVGNFIFREGADIRSASKIPTSHILIGTDDEGLPILEKIKL